MALNFKCSNCGGSYIQADVHVGDWSEVKNPYLGRIVTGPMIGKPCTCAAEWEKKHGVEKIPEEGNEERRQDEIHAIASEVHDILAEHGLEAMVAQAVAEAINRLGYVPRPADEGPRETFDNYKRRMDMALCPGKRSSA